MMKQIRKSDRLTNADWLLIFNFEWRPQLNHLLQIVRQNNNRAMSARQVTLQAPTKSIYSVVSGLNQGFKFAGLPYRFWPMRVYPRGQTHRLRYKLYKIGVS